MVSAIRYMHAHHVLHRDLKTANIFLTKDSIVKLGDFGISKLLSTKGGAAQTVLGKYEQSNILFFIQILGIDLLNLKFLQFKIPLGFSRHSVLHQP